MDPQIEKDKISYANERKRILESQRRKDKGAEIRRKQREKYHLNKEKISEERKRKNFEKTGGRTVGRPRKDEIIIKEMPDQQYKMSEDAVQDVINRSSERVERVHSPVEDLDTEESCKACDDREKEEKENEREGGIEAVTGMLRGMIEQMLDDEKEATRKLEPISDQFSGIVFAVMQMANMDVISKARAAEMISLFYHFDTGHFLHHTKFAEIVMGDKCMNYAKKMEANIIAYNRRTTKFRLDQGIEDLAKPHDKEDSDKVVYESN